MKIWFKGLFVVATGLLAILVPVVMVRAAPGSGSSASGSFNFLLGQGPLCSLEETACPDIAMAANGDTVAVNGTGTLSVHPSSVSGGGMFVHRDASGQERAHGTWEAKQLMSFVSYGNGEPQGLPANLFGGQAVIRVTLLVN